MFLKPVNVGDFQITIVGSDDWAECEKMASKIWKAMASLQQSQDIIEYGNFRVREGTDGNTYIEFNAKLTDGNWAKKEISTYTKKVAKERGVQDFPYYIAGNAPWVRYDSETKRNLVLFEGWQSEYHSEDIEGRGFENFDQWTPAVKSKEDGWRALEK